MFVRHTVYSKRGRESHLTRNDNVIILFIVLFFCHYFFPIFPSRFISFYAIRPQQIWMVILREFIKNKVISLWLISFVFFFVLLAFSPNYLQAIIFNVTYQHLDGRCNLGPIQPAQQNSNIRHLFLFMECFSHSQFVQMRRIQILVLQYGNLIVH